METVLLIGSGGREHAIAWKLAQSPKVAKIYVAPGNVGISRLEKVELVDLNVNDKPAILQWCQQRKVSLAVIGPEAPLASGLADTLQKGGLSCFGPGQVAAQIESDKIWSKQLMDAVGVPTARWQRFSRAADAKKFVESNTFSGWVIKASGLAAGKGVCVALTKQDALQFVDSLLVDKKFGAAGENIIIEEVLEGVEVSVLAFTDGTDVRVMPPAQDHKRALEGDKGGMTGGMGAYCPCPYLNKDEVKEVEETILKPVIDKLRQDGTPFIGVLYAGLMLTKDGPKVLEYNCRFGDPETEVLLPLLDSDLFEIMKACCTKQLKKVNVEWKKNQSAVTVIMASKGYPESSSKGDVIEGLDQAESLDNTLVFHCGTKLAGDSAVLTNGGRVLAVVAVAEQLTDAAAKANKACAIIRFAGAQYRKDIGHKGIARDILTSGELTYEQSGVSIDAADTLIDSIKSCAKSTNRSGVCGGIGGFGGLFDTKLADYKDPLLVSGTDGVGTKLKIAQATGLTSTIGIDLVAMCANDILTHGAEPLFFLDYYATGELKVQLAATVIGGIAEGCRQAGCALIGGETAEMPGMYEGGDFDLAGFVVGAVERDRLLPLVETICPGDAVIGLPSAGVHSNGYSMVRKVVALGGHDYSEKAPFSNSGNTLGEELLAPTKMYVKPILPILRQNLTKALAHITGGGLTENIPRILNNSIRVELDAACWNMPAVFPWLCATGRISEPQMLRTFNCGIGMVVICSQENKQSILDLIPEATVIGTVHARNSKDEPQVKVLNYKQVMEPLMLPYVKPVITKLMAKKRLAVLISGNGSNLQALIDATKGSTIAEIVLVISNKDDVKGLERAEKANILTKVIDHKKHSTRISFEKELDSTLRQAGVDFVALAGFMRVLTGYFVGKWKGRMVNLHPSLLPAFKGADALGDALAAGVRVTGCTVHFVEESVDAGVIISQAAVPVALDDTKETLAAKVHAAEHKIFPQAILDLAAGKFRLNLEGNRLVR